MVEAKKVHKTIKKIDRVWETSPKKFSKKGCLGCGDNFGHSSSKNHDYCAKCELNGSRCLPRRNLCSECGDGSGIIKFPNHPSRSCKLCSLKNSF